MITLTEIPTEYDIQLMDETLTDTQAKTIYEILYKSTYSIQAYKDLSKALRKLTITEYLYTEIMNYLYKELLKEEWYSE